jgi:hypothetical protein
MAATPDDNEVVKFLRRNGACKPAVDWALGQVNPADVTAFTFNKAWVKCPEPGWLLWALNRAGYNNSPGQKARQYACSCLTDVQSQFTDSKSQSAFKVLQDYVAGSATDAALAAARDDAQQAADSRGRLSILPERRAALALVAGMACATGDWVDPVDYTAGLAAEAFAADDTTIDWDLWKIRRQHQAELVRGLVNTSELQGLTTALHAKYGA